MLILDYIFIFSAISHLLILSLIIYNFLTAPKITCKIKGIHPLPGISILIPVRDEEKNIEKLISSIELQNLKDYEIIVLDDGSEDNTFKAVNKLKQKNSKIFLYRGAELPEGWLGKNWACYQLSKLARKNLLLFVDADVRLGENSIYSAVQIMKETSTDLLSVFPSQITASAGERLIVPLMHWLLLTFLPLIQVYKSSKSSIAAANGQFILIKREVYAAIGTHEEFKDRIVEDMEIVRCAKRKKFSVITCLGDGRITAKMYGSFKEAFQGFIKNFYPGFNISRFNFSIILSVYLVLFLFPYISVFWSLKNIYLIIAIIFERIFVSFLSKENIMFNVIFHPLQILIMFLIGLTSVLRKRKKWKGRLI